MKLINAMEKGVRRHLEELRMQSPRGDESCWCPLCRADTMALTLSSLPPRYATRRPADDSLAPETATAIRERISHARRQVERFPKHDGSEAVAAGAPVWIVNFPLEESFRAVDTILRQHEGVCDCWHCRCDMVAFALNRYPARYGVEHQGQTHLAEKDREQMRAELAGFLELAVRVVATIPRHEAVAAIA